MKNKMIFICIGLSMVFSDLACANINTANQQASSANDHKLTEQGVRAFNLNHYQTSFAKLSAASKARYAPAMFYLSKCYKYGLGVNVNLKRARSLLLKSAQLHDPLAESILATTYAAGSRYPYYIKKNVKLAEYYAARALPGIQQLIANYNPKSPLSVKSHLTTQIQYAWFYHYGLGGLKKNDHKTVYWITQGTKKQDVWS